jgi:hypothetical protein
MKKIEKISLRGNKINDNAFIEFIKELNKQNIEEYLSLFFEDNPFSKQHVRQIHQHIKQLNGKIRLFPEELNNGRQGFGRNLRFAKL